MPLRSYIHNEAPRQRDSQGRTGIYCQTCGRLITLVVNAQMHSVKKCAICVLKEQGVENPEEHVLNQYHLSNDPTKLPVPVDADMSLEAGILVLNPDEKAETASQVGGLFGTVRSLFKVLGFTQEEKEVPVSKEVAVKKRRRGLYD